MKTRDRFLALAAVSIAAIATLTACGPSAELTQAKTNYETAVADWDTAKSAFDDAVAKRDEIIADAPEAREAGAATLDELEAVLDAASNDGTKGMFIDLRLESGWDLAGELSDWLENETLGITEGDDAYVAQSPEVPSKKPTLGAEDVKGYELATQSLVGDIDVFTAATESVTGEADTATSFIKTMNNAASGASEAYLADAPAVVESIRAEATDGIARKRDASITGAQIAAADALQAAIDSGTVTAQQLLDGIGAARN